MVIAVFLGVTAIGHIAVYAAVVRFWGLRDNATLAHLRIIFAALAASFIVLEVATMRIYTKLGSWLYALSALWLGTVHWLFAASVLGAAAFALGGTFGASDTTRMLAGQVAIVLGLGVSAYGIINSNMTRVTRYAVAIKNLPESWAGKKLAVVSDLHFGNVRGKAFAEKMVRMVNAESPEIVLLAGDFFDGPAAPFEKFASPMSGMNAPKGVYFSEGNHEEFSPSQKYDQALTAAGVYVLSNKKIVVGGVEIIGINYNVSNTNKDAAKVLAEIGVSKDMPSILIKHAPTGIAAVAEAGIDLQVSGHTHRGQVWPGSLLTKKIFGEFEYGMHKKGNLTVVTSSGAGTWGPPQRVGTHAEIVIITLLKG